SLRWRRRFRRPGAGACRHRDPRFTSRRAGRDRRSRSADAIVPEAAADGGVCVVLPLVALVGRPNVGKSTLFNRIVGKRLAIVQDVPGVTRDRQYAEAQQGAKRFRVVDTGGFTLRTDEQLVRAVREQADAAVREADAIVLVVDAVEGLSAADRELAQLLRRGGKPVFLAANKVDSNRREEQLDLGELHSTGFDVFPLSETAGLRKKRQVVDKVEVSSAQRALRAVERADVVVVLTDATQLGVDQDARIAAQAEERGRAVILAVNKWDLVQDKDGEAQRLREQAERHLQ